MQRAAELVPLSHDQALVTAKQALRLTSNASTEEIQQAWYNLKTNLETQIAKHFKLEEIYLLEPLKKRVVTLN